MNSGQTESAAMVHVDSLERICYTKLNRPLILVLTISYQYAGDAVKKISIYNRKYILILQFDTESKVI